ncbi:MAG: PBP1A family penicillin-binding protein [Myxococcota bacterium]
MAIFLGRFIALALLAAFGGAVAFYLVFLRDLPTLDQVSDYEPALASHLLDRHGRPIGTFYRERRSPISLEEIPRRVINAFVAAEDASFFEHQGIDFQAILRALWSNLRDPESRRQGASTITQQTVKTLLLTPERTYRRKIREMFLARRLEERFSKQEILFLYLNQIYFGHGAYGLREAARSYFDKSVQELDLSEIAMLAGLPKAPSKFSPFRNPSRAEERRVYVLGRMRAENFIDESDLREALENPPPLVAESRDAAYSTASAYFNEQVRRYLFDALGGKTVLEGGLRVETTLDADLQRAAVDAVRQGVEALDTRQGYRGATGHVEPQEMEAEILRVAEANRLAFPESGAGSTPTPVEVTRARFDEQEVLEAVVTRVDPTSNSATVALAPGLEAAFHLSDARWLRAGDGRQRPRLVKHIEDLLAVGDVATFRAAPEAEDVREAPEGAVEGEAAAGQPMRVLLDQSPAVQAALLSLEIASGEVLALVGGYDFAQSEFDRVTQARRQPGSAFKPMIYGAALAQTDSEGRHRFTPVSIVHDRPKVYEDRSTGFVWKPQNYGRQFYGPITLRLALAKSINNAAVHLADEVGVDHVIDYSRQLGIQSPLERSLALALGTSGVSLMELTRAYAAFPSGGRRVVPRFIRRVLDREGNLLLENVELGSDPTHAVEEQRQAREAIARAEQEHLRETQAREEALDRGEEPIIEAEPEPDPDQLIPAEDAFLVADMLHAVVKEGTGWRLKELGRPLAGKTGTTNDQADAWFMGFSPGIATGVWVGHDESHFLGYGETGSRAAAPIWVNFMRAALADRPVRDFSAPSSIVWTRIDRETGLLASRNSKETAFQAFVAGSEPQVAAETRRSDAEALRDLREEALSGPDSLQLMQLDPF